MYLSTDISTLHFSDLSWCAVELLPHVVIRHLCVAWRYVTAAKPTHCTCNRNLRSHTMVGDHTKSPCRCHLPKLVL